jgi:predicted nucleic acid-binding Zn ribbon protein
MSKKKRRKTPQQNIMAVIGILIVLSMVILPLLSLFNQ